MYDCAYIVNARKNYWGVMYDPITKYNENHDTPLSNVKIRAAIYKVTREEEEEENIVMVDKLDPQRNESENSKYLINKLVNLTIKYTENDSNRATARDVQVQFAGDLSKISYQNLLRFQVIAMRQ